MVAGGAAIYRRLLGYVKPHRRLFMVGVLGMALFAWFFWFIFSGITAVQRGQMIVLMVLIVISALFWGLYEQTYGTWVAFTERGMTKDLFPGLVTAAALPFPG